MNDNPLTELPQAENTGLLLHQAISRYFDLDDIRELSLQTGIEFENLPDTRGTRIGAARSLVQELLQRRRLNTLREAAKKLRPTLDWNQFPAEPAEGSWQEAGEPPFKGLLPFDENDSHLFFGRNGLCNKLWDRLQEEPFLAVLGASGSGKSSLVRAGLLPRLRQEKAGWDIHVVTPGRNPLQSLAAALTDDVESVTATSTLMDDLLADSRSLDLYAGKRLQRRQAPIGACLLLLVDQFEELFTGQPADDEQAAKRSETFINNLMQAISAEASGRVQVIITLRADYYHRCAPFDTLRQALEKHQIFIGAMSRNELQQAIEKPAEAGGWQFAPGLVAQILSDLGADRQGRPEPGALPLLSHALLACWQQRQGRIMTLAGYQSIGGVHGAIANTADRVYHEELTASQQKTARQLFMRLVLVEPGADYARRRAALAEIGEKVRDVVELLADRRLLTTSKEGVEIAHEALIDRWPLLQEWLQEDLEGLRRQQHIARAAQAWEELARPAGELYRGPRLEQALEWAAENPGRLIPLEEDFLAASRQAREEEQQARTAALLQAMQLRQWQSILLGLAGGGGGFGLAYLLANSSLVLDVLILVKTLQRLFPGALSGLLLTLSLERADNQLSTGRRWLYAAGGGAISLALLFLVHAILASRPSEFASEAIPALLQGAVFGAFCGAAALFILHSDRPRRLAVPPVAVVGGLLFWLLNLAGGTFLEAIAAPWMILAGVLLFLGATAGALWR